MHHQFFKIDYSCDSIRWLTIVKFLNPVSCGLCGSIIKSSTRPCHIRPMHPNYVVRQHYWAYMSILRGLFARIGPLSCLYVFYFFLIFGYFANWPYICKSENNPMQCWNNQSEGWEDFSFLVQATAICKCSQILMLHNYTQFWESNNLTLIHVILGTH